MNIMNTYVAMVPYQGTDRPLAAGHTLASAQAACEQAEGRHRDPRDQVECQWVEKEGQSGTRVWSLVTRYRLRRSADMGWGRWSDWSDSYYYVHEVPSVEVVYPHYTSTYCIHEQHDQCRLTCKTCERECLCACHGEAQP